MSSIIRYNLVCSEEIAGIMTERINIARQSNESNRVFLSILHIAFLGD